MGKKTTQQSIWEELMKNEFYLENLNKLPPDERAEIQKALKKLVEQFESNVLKPLQK